MMLFKRGSLLVTSWAELYAIVLAVLGFVLAVSIKIPTLSYIVIVIAGFLCGRLLFEQKSMHKFPSYMMVFGFFIGYILGSFYTSRKILLFIAVASVVISYYSHNKGIV